MRKPLIFREWMLHHDCFAILDNDQPEHPNSDTTIRHREEHQWWRRFWLGKPDLLLSAATFARLVNWRGEVWKLPCCPAEKTQRRRSVARDTAVDAFGFFHASLSAQPPSGRAGWLVSVSCPVSTTSSSFSHPMFSHIWKFTFFSITLANFYFRLKFLSWKHFPIQLKCSPILDLRNNISPLFSLLDVSF